MPRVTVGVTAGHVARLAAALSRGRLTLCPGVLSPSAPSPLAATRQPFPTSAGLSAAATAGLSAAVARWPLCCCRRWPRLSAVVARRRAVLSPGRRSPARASPARVRPARGSPARRSPARPFSLRLGGRLRSAHPRSHHPARSGSPSARTRACPRRTCRGRR